MRNSMAQAATDTSATGIRFLLILLVTVAGVSLFAGAASRAQLGEQLAPAPYGVAWSVSGDTLVAYGMPPSHIRCGSVPETATLLATIDTGQGEATRIFPATKQTKPYPVAYTEHRAVSGPWVAHSSPSTLAKIRDVRLLLHCTRTAYTSRVARLEQLQPP